MLYALARPLLFSLDPETAHGLTLRFAGLYSLLGEHRISRPVKAMGLEFPNPVGLAAGLDKHATHADALSRMGFGFIELGGVTLRPQPGNPKPRMFRLPEAGAVINRLGFNSVGLDAFVENLRASTARRRCVVGVNLGRNKDTPNERVAQEYGQCLEKLYPWCDYVTINVSSPNTKGLRDMQAVDALAGLMAHMRGRREALREQHGRHVALTVKISADLTDEQLRDIADAVRRERMDGIIAANTTTARAGVEGLPHAAEEGGLSGAPLRDKATRAIRLLAAQLKGELPIIGGGGIMSGADAREKFEAGSSLVQIYTGMVFRGPRLIRECIEAWPGPAGQRPA